MGSWKPELSLHCRQWLISQTSDVHQSLSRPVSYYYGVVQPAIIMSALNGLDAPLGYDTPQGMSQPTGNYFMSKTFPLFRTKGNFVADCMRGYLR